MKAGIILRRDPVIRGWFATVRQFTESQVVRDTWLWYDTTFFPSKAAALAEARAFCRWKKMKVAKIVTENKGG